MKKYEIMGEELRFMDLAIRHLNDESFIDSWLMEGVADGDCEIMSDEELGEYYDEDFDRITSLFKEIMFDAFKIDIKDKCYETFYIAK